MQVVERRHEHGFTAPTHEHAFRSRFFSAGREHGLHPGSQAYGAPRTDRLPFLDLKVAELGFGCWVHVNVRPLQSQRLAVPHARVEHEGREVFERLGRRVQIDRFLLAAEHEFARPLSLQRADLRQGRRRTA
jgi:hypothetical protein